MKSAQAFICAMCTQLIGSWPKSQLLKNWETGWPRRLHLAMLSKLIMLPANGMILLMHQKMNSLDSCNQQASQASGHLYCCIESLHADPEVNNCSLDIGNASESVLVSSQQDFNLP